MGRVFQRSFKPTHAIKHNGSYCMSGEENTPMTIEDEALKAVKSLKPPGCDETRFEMLKVLNRGFL